MASNLKISDNSVSIEGGLLPPRGEAGQMLVKASDTDYDAVWTSDLAVDWADITDKPETYAPSAHTHAIAEVTGLSAELAGKEVAGAAAIVKATLETELTMHTSRADNPHAVTAAQVGLGNVNNTADLDKPVSSAVQAALNAKSAIDHDHAVATAASNGFLPALSGNAKQYLNGSGGWAFPSTVEPRIPQTLDKINSTGLVARWLLDGTLTDQVSGRVLTRAGTWNTTSYNIRWDIELNQNVIRGNGANYYTFSPTGLPSGSDAGTICCWVKFRSTSSIIPFGYGNAQTGLQMRAIEHTSTSLNFALAGSAVSSGENLLYDGTWHHLAGVAAGGTNGATGIFIDGVQFASSSLTLATVLTDGRILATPNVASGYGVCDVADARVYSTALTAAQVLAIAQGLA